MGYFVCGNGIVISVCYLNTSFYIQKISDFMIGVIGEQLR